MAFFALAYSCIRKMAKQSLSVDTSGPTAADLLVQWKACVDVLVSFTGITGSAACETAPPPSRAFFDLLPAFMRTGRFFLESLLRSSMALLNGQFKNNGSEVLTLLRSVQQLTRFLQRSCVHAKSRREARLMPLIPQTRKCLEAFVCNVKLLLSQNKCEDAFWLGNLKNRDLTGQEVRERELSTRHSSGIQGGSISCGSQMSEGLSVEGDELAAEDEIDDEADEVESPGDSNADLYDVGCDESEDNEDDADC